MSKPKIFETARAVADANLETKIQILMYFSSAGIPWVLNADGTTLRDAETGRRVMDFCPVNELQFARWSSNGAQERALLNCPVVSASLIERFGSFTSHGIDSLKKRGELRARVLQLFNALKVASIDQAANEDHRPRMRALEADVERWKVSSESMAGFVQQTLEKKSELERDLVTLKRAFDSAKKAYAEFEADAQLRLQAKDDQLSELRRELREKLRLVKP